MCKHLSQFANEQEFNHDQVSLSFSDLNSPCSQVFKNEQSEPLTYDQEEDGTNYGEANTFRLVDILAMCDPPVRYEEVAILGATIDVHILWKCHTDSSPSKKKACVPEIKAARVIYHETDNGFQFDYAEYPDTPAVHHDQRTLVQLAGVRVSFHTSGTGGAFSIVDIVFRIAMVLALLTIANVVVDFFMCWIAPRSRQNYNRKYEMTPDFTDFFVAQERAASIRVQGNAALNHDDDSDDDDESGMGTDHSRPAVASL